LPSLCAAIKDKDREALIKWKKGEQWRTVEEIIAAHGENSQLRGRQTDRQTITDDLTDRQM